MINRKFLYFVVFSSGMTTLALEFSASRLLGGVFGTSNLVWASVIGLILIYLTLGYFIGGPWADRSPYPKTLFRIIAWASFISGLVPLISRPVLWVAADAFDQLQVGILLGSFFAVLVLFSLPVTLLGMVSPFAIRLAIRDQHEAGRVSGFIYAISTLGSFIGTFLPVLVLIPLVGTTWTFLIYSIFLLIVALVGLWLSCGWRSVLELSWMPIVLLIFAIFIASRPIKTTQGQIYETESAYNYIQVVEQEEYRILRLNEGQGQHSIWHPTQIEFNGPWMQFIAAPFFNKPPFTVEDVESMAIVGLAAGTVARQATEVFGAIPIDGFEIDPKIIQVGQEYFGMTQPNLNPIAKDGRVGLQQSERQYTIIGIDAYRPPYIPWHLTTQEYFQVVFDHLDRHGVMVINVGRSPEECTMLEGLVSTIQTVFPSVYVMNIPGTFNSIIYATRQPTQIENLYQNLLALYVEEDTPRILVDAIQRIVVNLQPTQGNGMIFTDDWAPIEWITNNMVLYYVMGGDLEDLKEGMQE
jgi:predicted membrane-bound spermidine synthase